MFDRPFFKEFVLETSGDVGDVLKKAVAAGFDLGPALHAFSFPASGQNNRLSAGLLVAVTEKRTRAELDNLIAALGK